MIRQRVIYGIARWVASLAAFSLAAIYLNHALFSAWQTVAAPGYQHAELWEYSAYLSIGYAFTLICIGVLAAVNIRWRWPNLRSKWNVLLLGGALAALIWPRAWHFIEIDACLDSGSRWDYEYERCSSDA
jgi:hypothetical protein